MNKVWNYKWERWDDLGKIITVDWSEYIPQTSLIINLVENWEPTGEIAIIGRLNLLDYAKQHRDELKSEMELELEAEE